jgi:hypothetical protein
MGATRKCNWNPFTLRTFYYYGLELWYIFKSFNCFRNSKWKRNYC